MKTDNNPAKRLLAILSEAKQKPPNWPVKKVWAEIFQTPESNLPRIFYFLALLQELVNEVEKEIRNLDVDHDVYLQHIPKFRAALAHPNFDSHWNDAMHHLSEAALLSLQFCSESLRTHTNERIVPDEEVQNIKKEIDELFEQVKESGINAKLRAILLEMLEAMRRALAEYRINGAKGLRKEIFSVLERLQRNFELVSEHKNEPLIGKFLDVLTKYDTLTSVYINAPQIIASFQRLLPGMTP